MFIQLIIHKLFDIFSYVDIMLESLKLNTILPFLFIKDFQ